jgi:hypothetical protein
MRNFETFGGTTIFHGDFTIITLNEQQMTAIVQAVGVVVARFSALMTL